MFTFAQQLVLKGTIEVKLIIIIITIINNCNNDHKGPVRHQQ